MEQAAERLARALAAADADAVYRRALLQRKCEELERVLRALERGTASSGGPGEPKKQQEAQQKEFQEVGQSIQDAIDRARRARAEMAKREKRREEGRGSSGEDGEEEEALESILTMARRIRDGQPTDAAEELQEAKPLKTATQITETRELKEPTRMHVEYPRKLKFVVDQLEDKRGDPFRFAFCCKVSEHLSMNQARRELLEEAARSGKLSSMSAPIARIQAPFPKQVERLGRAYARLDALVSEKLDASSEQFQRILQAPTLARLFPVCTRLKLANQLLRTLDSERNDLASRLPERPVLSAASRAHRDAMLSRLRSKRPKSSSSADKSAISNAPLVKTVENPADRDLLDALEASWANNSSDCQRTYSAKVRELALNDTSNLVLAAFKQLFAEDSEPPNESDVASMMRIVRLVDSIALSRGRRFRSIVAPDVV